MEVLNNIYYYWRKKKTEIRMKRNIYRSDSVCLNRPVFLLGVQGGGLTLVRRILSRSPSFVSVTGDNTYWNGSGEMQNVLGKNIPKEFRLKRHPLVENGEVEESWEYETDKNINYFRKERDDASDELKKQMQNTIKAIKYIHSNTPSSKRFIDKSQTFTLKSAFINELLGNENPFFILVTRNPYAMTYRAATKIYSSSISIEDRLTKACEHWRNSMLAAINDSKHLENFFSVRFEDVVSNPANEISEICDYLGLEFSTDMLPSPEDTLPFGGIRDNKWYPIRKNINDKYLEELSETQLYQINSELGELASVFDYVKPC